MPKLKKEPPSKQKLFSDFWLGKHDVPDISSEEELVGGFNFKRNGQFEGQYNQKIIELASARRAIGNFVSILTNRDIPVIFSDSRGTGATDGKNVIISASIIKKDDFDWGVGLALHEGAHILLTDMHYFNVLWKKIPQDIVNAAEQKGITRNKINFFCKFIFNYVEDRYIDTYIFDTAPGYRGYYSALYNKFFHNEEIDKALKSDGWRTLTLSSYEMRIINLTNRNSDLKALPSLDKIYEMIGFKNIRRLKTTKDRFELALDIVRKVLENVDKKQQKTQDEEDKKSATSETIDKIIGIIDATKNNESDVIGGTDGTANNDKEDEESDDIGSHGFSPKELKKILKELEKQKDFLLGKIDKKNITEEEKNLLKIIEDAGIHIVSIQNPLIGNGVPKVDCLIVKKLTKKLIDSGILPMCSGYNISCRHDNKVEADPNMIDIVNKGILLGTMLGRKLMIRREENLTKYTRRQNGKIDKRILAGIGAGLEDIFYQTKMYKYGKANLHITVDASGSMDSMDKWGPTMICVVAICKAASMIPNLRVSVSFRTTSHDNNGTRPYIILAYDSEVDKFEKVKLLFPYLTPNGSTPEGLAMEAIVKSFISKTLDGTDYYFLNLSDGEPCYSSSEINYSGEIAFKHTRDVINKLRRNGLKILSYFISDSSYGYHSDAFKKMYGQDAKFINVTNAFDIARTMNEMFLRK